MSFFIPLIAATVALIANTSKTRVPLDRKVIFVVLLVDEDAF
jgi:hypothetical protein